MHIEREARQTRSVPMTPLIDVVFLLLIFFMLSTSFVRTESLELALPQSKAQANADTTKQLLQVYVTKEGFLFVGKKAVNEQHLVKNLKEMLLKTPDLNILLLGGEGVNVQQLVKVMDNIYLAGGKNLSVASWGDDMTNEANE